MCYSSCLNSKTLALKIRSVFIMSLSLFTTLTVTFSAVVLSYQCSLSQLNSLTGDNTPDQDWFRLGYSYSLILHFLFFLSFFFFFFFFFFVCVCCCWLELNLELDFSGRVCEGYSSCMFENRSCFSSHMNDEFCG